MVSLASASMVSAWRFSSASRRISSSPRNGDAVGVGAGLRRGVSANSTVAVSINLFGVFTGGVRAMKSLSLVATPRAKSTAFRLSSSKRRENPSRLRSRRDTKPATTNVPASIALTVMICKTNKTAFAAIRSELGNTYSQAPATYTALDAASARRTHGASNSTPVTARYHRSTLRASCDTSASIAVGVPAVVGVPAARNARAALSIASFPVRPALRIVRLRPDPTVGLVTYPSDVSSPRASSPLVVGPAVSSASGGLDASGHARCQYPSSPRFVYRACPTHVRPHARHGFFTLAGPEGGSASIARRRRRRRLRAVSVEPRRNTHLARVVDTRRRAARAGASIDDGMAERAPLLIARDVEAAVSTREGARATREGAGEGVGATDEDDGWLARARGAMMDATTRRGSVGRLSSALALVGALAALACVAGLGGDRGVAARAGLGSHHGHKKEILEGSTKNCVNAAADNAAGTFQMETSKCEDLSTPGCVGHRSMCRFCQTHMATNRNHDWPVCPATVCAENDVHGCKSESGKKMTKRELAWDILRQHVLDHNSMVAGIKIGKCHGNSQDHGLGRYQYSDSQCLRSGLPGCLGAGAACRFCNVKNAKKAGNEWPTCPMAVCDKYDVKSKYCAKLTQYHVPPETPPKDWDEKSLPDTMSSELRPLTGLLEKGPFSITPTYLPRPAPLAETPL